MNYFDQPHCSNSKLSQLQKELKGDATPAPYEAYRFGSLFDAVVTEQHKIDRIRNIILETDYSYTNEELSRAEQMKRALMKDRFCADLIMQSQMQVEKYAELTLRYDGIVFTLPMKCKYDFLTPGYFADLKSTTATTQAQFEAACEQFDYWRQCAIYGQLGGLKRAMFIGVSKVNYKVFKVPLLYQDARWQKGAEQFRYLAFKYWLLNSNN